MYVALPIWWSLLNGTVCNETHKMVRYGLIRAQNPASSRAFKQQQRSLLLHFQLLNMNKIFISVLVLGTGS